MAFETPSRKPQFLLNTSTSLLVVVTLEEERPAMAKQTTWMVVMMIKGSELSDGQVTEKDSDLLQEALEPRYIHEIGGGD